jgi:hypothetical protein
LQALPGAIKNAQHNMRTARDTHPKLKMVSLL